MNSSTSSFQESWGFPNEIQQQVDATSYDIQMHPGNFSSGRPKWVCYFMNRDRKVICKRLGMQLTSKKGKSYHVFSITEWKEPTETKLSVDEVYAQ
jgi:hypothetical protein